MKTNKTIDTELEVGAIIATLVHTYLDKLEKPRNKTELMAYRRKVFKLKEVARNKLEALLLNSQKDLAIKIREALPKEREVAYHTIKEDLSFNEALTQSLEAIDNIIKNLGGE